MSLTSNFDFAVELGLDPVKAIFHLAFKNEDRFPHHIGPVTRTYSGQAMSISVLVLDDDTDAADLRFADQTHMAFSFPFQITVQVPDAPDPSLSQIVLKARTEIPALLTHWAEAGEDVLGLSFDGVQAADVTIQHFDGLPTLDASNYKAAIDTRYGSIPHRYSFQYLGTNELLLYDGNRDPTLAPANAATPYEIDAAIEAHGADHYLKLSAPIHVSAPGAFCNSFGRLIFWRLITPSPSGTSISVDFTQEPADASLATQVQLDSGGPAASLVISMLTPLARNAIASFGTITEPVFTQAAAESVLRGEIASYLNPPAGPLRFPVYTPKSGDPNVPLSTPVGFLLPADGVLAILMNRRSGTAADDAPPDNFLGSSEVALAVGRERFNEFTAAAIAAQFKDPEIHTKEGSATLKKLDATLSDPGEHDVARGHLWISGEAEVHIDCWPDPDVSFEGPIFLNAQVTETDTECSMHIEAEAGDFDFDESCCDVFLDVIIPIVGWIMLAVVESTIDSVGGELAVNIASQQGQQINAIPPVVNGVAEVQACLEDILVQSQGVVMPGKLRVRRLGRSFEDLADSGDLPKP